MKLDGHCVEFSLAFFMRWHIVIVERRQTVAQGEGDLGVLHWGLGRV